MGLEVANFISDLVASNPTGSDNASTADDHCRLIKSAVKNTFPNVAGAVTPTHTELNHVDGVTSAIQVQLDAKASASALNASNLTSGTVPDARFPATLPAASGANLTALNAANLASGSIPDARVQASNVAQHYARNITGKTGVAKTLSTSAPSGGSDGDIWFRY